MSYITYFDLLGTRGFCDDSELYYDNLIRFNKAVYQTGSLLLDYGEVGVFSDSAYAESRKLKLLLKFLVLLRNRLMADGLFFNAVVKKGELGIKSLADYAKNVYGVAFQNKEIAKLYIAQTNFKGIGIFIDTSITDQELVEADCLVSDCIFMKRISNNFNDEFIPIGYRDISLKAYDSLANNNKKYWETILELFLRRFYEAFIKNPKHGAYYISLFSNFIRSFGTDLTWDMKTKSFHNAPIIFDIINKMVTTSYDNLRNLPGLECLVLVMLDVAYCSDSLNEHEKDSITKEYAKINCISNKYLQNLDSLPQGIFHSTSAGNYRDRFIRYCQKHSAGDFVNTVFPN